MAVEDKTMNSKESDLFIEALRETGLVVKTYDVRPCGFSIHYNGKALLGQFSSLRKGILLAEIYDPHLRYQIHPVFSVPITDEKIKSIPKMVKEYMS